MEEKNPVSRQYTKYETDEDRRKGLLAAFLRYSSKPWTCDICSKTILKGNKSKHLKSKNHDKIKSQNNETIANSGVDVTKKLNNFVCRTNSTCSTRGADECSTCDEDDN